MRQCVLIESVTRKARGGRRAPSYPGGLGVVSDTKGNNERTMLYARLRKGLSVSAASESNSDCGEKRLWGLGLEKKVGAMAERAAWAEDHSVSTAKQELRMSALDLAGEDEDA